VSIWLFFEKSTDACKKGIGGGHDGAEFCMYVEASELFVYENVSLSCITFIVTTNFRVPNFKR
jgi:hypothetical protein